MGGKFVKGQSGNPNGRPPKAKVEAGFIESLSVEIPLKSGESSKQFLERALAYYANMMEKAKNTSEVENYLKMGTEVANKLIGYEKPRISSIESIDTKPTAITVSWETPEVIPDDHPMKKYMDASDPPTSK